MPRWADCLHRTACRRTLSRHEHTYTAHALFRIPLQQSRKDQGTDKIAKPGGEDKVHGTGGGQVVNAAEQHLRSAAEQEKQVSKHTLCYYDNAAYPVMSCKLPPIVECNKFSGFSILQKASFLLENAFGHFTAPPSQHDYPN